MDLREYLGLLTEASGVSGYEHRISDIIQRAWRDGVLRDYIDELRTDRLGNLVMFKAGTGDVTRPKVMLAAHMDEIGLMVTKIEKDGFLRFTSVGGIDQRVLVSQEVVVHGRRDLIGVIGSTPPHLQAPGDKGKSIKREDMFIDLGLPKSEVKSLVSVGDVCMIRRSAIDLKNGLIAGKAIDDRAGVLVMLQCLKELSRYKFGCDVYCVATTQEEVGLRGAIVSTFGIVPDVGIAIDVGHGDMPGVPEHQTLILDKGPGIGIGPHVHPKVYEKLNSVADELGICKQVDPSPYPGGTDAFAIQVTQSGIPTGLLSIPLRYMHTSVETVAAADIKRTSRLIAGFITGIDSKWVEGLKCY